MILKGDCLEVIKSLKDNSIDALITDPPYHLTSGKDGKGGFMGKTWDGGGIAFQIDTWKAMYRVLKPGGSMLVMGGDRTFHRLAVAIEDSGFSLKHTLCWLFGSGFPKAQDVTNILKKRGIETDEYRGMKIGGIKPSVEFIIWAIKKPEKSFVDNILKWGTGFVNVDATRISTTETKEKNVSASKASRGIYGNYGEALRSYGSGASHNKGRFPSNCIFSHHPECRRRGVKRVKGNSRPGQSIAQREIKNGVTYQPPEKRIPCKLGDPDGLETVESYRCHKECPIGMLDEMSQSAGQKVKPGYIRKSDKTKDIYGKYKDNPNELNYTDKGTASRFFLNLPPEDVTRFLYCAKASRSQRQAGLGSKEGSEGELKNIHPT